ncbi:MAG: family 20 glycosylhydrolase [Holophagales bacterium]|jgi:N-acetyl-beta-hexosaminidase|nr:family 20 glycosylhydrolase [Holophagales bacterium]
MQISQMLLNILKAPKLRFPVLTLQAVLAILVIGAGTGLGRVIENNAKVLEESRRVPPTLVKGSWKPPAVPASHRIEFYGSDNVNVVALDGSYYRPLVGMDVNVMYRITNVNNQEDSIVSQGDIAFKVKGKYSDRGHNPEPDVIPALREWHGGKGEFRLTQQSRLVAPSGENAARSAAQKTQNFFKEMLGLELNIAATGGAGCVEFIHAPSLLGELGDEGYCLAIDEKISIKAASEKGLMYGGITVTQILYGSKDKRTAPRGEARDYPRYPIRAGMIDVGRQYIPLKYLEEIGKYMAWFKLNELQVHLNDYWAATGYKAFRLQSEKHPTINLNIEGNTKSDGYYTKDKYRAFQKELLKYGVEVVNEIDTPAHSEIFRNAGLPMRDIGDMDITSDSNRSTVVNFILDLFDEYTSGPDPVFVGRKVHFGSDEYGGGSPSYQQFHALYNKAMMEGLLARGLKVRTWTEFASYHADMPDELAKNPNVAVNMWAPYYADVKSVYGKGYSVINTVGGWLYLVPGCATGYPDYWGRVYANNGDYRLDYLYNSFDANNFSPKRNAGRGTAIMPKAHPQTKGVQFCVWHDFPSFNGGLSEFDLFDRMRDVIPFVAEKAWHGEKTNGQTYALYAARFSKLANRSPGGNPGRFVESASELIASYHFGPENALNDSSGNGYTALAEGAAITSNGLELSGNGKISLPFGSIGYPYTVRLMASFADVPANTVLFKGKDGTLYANYEGRGRIGFERGEKGIEYHFEFVDADGMMVSNPAISPDTWFDIVFTCNKRFSDEGKPAQTDTALYIDGAKQAGRATCVWIHNGKSFIPITNNSGNRNGVAYDSNSLVLPVEGILPGAKAIVKRIDIFNKKMSDAEILDLYKAGKTAAEKKTQ